MPTKNKYFYNIPLIVLGTCILAGSIFLGCGKKESTKMPPKPQAAPPPVATPQAEAEEEEEKPVYVYAGDRFRDPFAEIGSSTGYKEDAVFNPQQAQVKAIVYGRQLRSAVIQIPGSGSYFIKGKRIFDIMGKNVKGFHAKVFIDKVVVTSDTDDIYELKIREDDEEEGSDGGDETL